MTAVAPDEAGRSGPSAARFTAGQFRMVLPGTWASIPLDPKTRDRRIQRMVERRLGKADNIAHIRRQTIVELRKAAANARENGAFMAAVCEQKVEDVVLSASCMAMLTPLLNGPDAQPMESAEQIEVYFSANPPGGKVSRVLEHSVVELDVGRAARVRKLAGVGVVDASSDEPESDVVEFFVPLPGTSSMLTLVFSTPLLPAGDHFARLFDLIAATATWIEAPSQEEQP